MLKLAGLEEVVPLRIPAASRRLVESFVRPMTEAVGIASSSLWVIFD